MTDAGGCWLTEEEDFTSLGACDCGIIMASLVLVTDGTSFTSSYIIHQLQEEGHHVRATVTSLQEEEEHIKVLHELSPEAKFKVEVVEADPAKADTWENAMKDVQYVIHAITPIAAQAPAAEGEAVVQPAVESVLNVFKACVASNTVKRVILTSSYQAISATPSAATDKVFTEADWTDAETADPLIKSLVLAEKAAWDFVKELTDADKIELCVMNPTIPMGPPLIEPQQDVVKLLLDRGITGCARVNYSLVDVRDVAMAHVKALSLDGVADNRHILHGSNLWMKDVSQALAKELKPLGYNIPSLCLPNVALWGLSLFNKTAKTFLPVVGKQIQFDNSRMKDVLGITPRDVKEAVVEEASALIQKGLIKKPKKVKNQGASVAAEGDAKVEEDAEKKDEEAAEKPKENGDVKEEEGKKIEEKEPAEEGDVTKLEEKKEEKEEQPPAAEEKKEEGEGEAPAAETAAEK